MTGAPKAKGDGFAGVHDFFTGDTGDEVDEFGVESRSTRGAVEELETFRPPPPPRAPIGAGTGERGERGTFSVEECLPVASDAYEGRDRACETGAVKSRARKSVRTPSSVSRSPIS